MQWATVQTRGEEDLDLVLAAQRGDPEAFGVLFDRWFDRVFDVAFRIVRNRDTAAEVSQDVFLAAWQQLAALEQPASFGGWLLRTSRNRALNRLDRERRSVTLGDETTTMMIDRHNSAPDAGGPVEQREQVDLVWAAAEALGERDASVLDLHLRHGLGAAEIGDALGVTANNAHQLLFRLKARLAAAVRGWVLWREGEPACPLLARALHDAGIVRFGAQAVQAIERHTGDCEACAGRQRLRLSPEAMFAAVPIVVAGPFLRAEAASALSRAGVPMGRAAASGPGGGGGGGVGGVGGWGGSSGVPAGAVERRRHRRRRRQRRRMRAVALSAGAVLIVAAAVLVMAEPVHDPVLTALPVGTESLPATTAPPAPSTTTAPSITTVPVTVGAAATIPPLAPSTTTAPPPPRTDPAPPTTLAPPPATTTAPPPTEPPPDTSLVPIPSLPPGPPDSPPDSPPAATPTIDSFTATLSRLGSCVGTTAQQTVTLRWSSTDADTATITGPGAPDGPLPATGSATACVGPTSTAPTYSLTVTGPGGSATETATAS